jgi:hypothetical protein
MKFLKFLIFIIIAAIFWFIMAIITSEGIPFADYVIYLLTEEIVVFIIITVFSIVASRMMMYGVSAQRRKNALAAIESQSPPFHIKNNSQIFALAIKFGGVLYGSTNNLKRLRTLIEPGENLYFVAALASTHIHDVNEPPGDSTVQDLFLSDRRVLMRNSSSGEVQSFPLREIVSIGLEKNPFAGEVQSYTLRNIMSIGYYEKRAFAFCTEKTNVSFTSLKTCSNVKEIYNVFSLALEAVGVVFRELDANKDQTVSSDTIEPISQTQRVVECPGCGAAINVIVGQTNQCEYCRRLVSG